MLLWFTLACDKNSKGNALEMANAFYETGWFMEAQPDFMVKIETTGYCDNVNDPLFADQWNLKNTGQNGGTSGIDINICDAWEITKGSADIVVAVIDGGIQLDHPDLPNMYEISYDGMSGLNQSELFTEHGTNCAGIIGAAHNTFGISGIAPNCSLMSISHLFNDRRYVGDPDMSQTLANSFLFASNCGADVISCSFGISGNIAGSNQIIEDALNNVLETGRCGLGCVLVFSSGNNGAPICNGVIYPQNSIPNILVVGAIDNTGNLWQSSLDEDTCHAHSSYGIELDVVAPGALLPTTTIGGNYVDFEGTSSAAPHVAGLAALILSKNPCLTQTEVTSIIESNTSKLSRYSYYASKPNGCWNLQVGYGLINCTQALNATPNPSTSCSNNPTVIIQNETFVNEAIDKFGCYLYIKDVKNTNNSIVHYKFRNSVIIDFDFLVDLGSEIFIDNCCK